MSIDELLKSYARHYETVDFLFGDPSWFMHQVSGVNNQEAMAFVASALSYGSRKQFLSKISSILECSGNDIDTWIRSGRYEDFFRADDKSCFYRLYTYSAMHDFMRSYSELMHEHGTLGEYVRGRACDGFTAIESICKFFRINGSGGIIPKDTTSACKRICMFLRWMVRTDSPVDLGLWTFIDKRTLLIPLDTHVLQEARRLGLVSSCSASMSACKRLTSRLAQVFPEDPLLGDFALFGYGVDVENRSSTNS